MNLVLSLNRNRSHFRSMIIFCSAIVAKMVYHMPSIGDDNG
jgi:hypothetical protein